MTRTCRYEPCSKEFTPNHPRQEFCEPTCRANQHYVDHPEKGRGVRRGALQSVAAPPKEPFDRDRILTALKARGSQGIHSHEIRRLGLSGHPSMRVSELEERGYEIEHHREHKGRRPGVRYVLVSEPDSVTEAKAA